MEHRIGICASCEANYTIPANFEHDQARCRECGGTVKIGPVVGGEPNPASGELEEYVPSGRKRSGPSMMEQLRARRAEDDGDEEVEAEPAPAKASARKPAKKAAKASARKGGASARKSNAGGGSSKKASASKRGTGSNRKSGGGRSSKRSSPEKKKGSAGMLIGVGGIVVLLGAGGYFFKDDLFGSAPAVDAASTDAAAETAAADATAEGDSKAMADKTMPEKTMPDKSPTETKGEDKSETPAMADKEAPKAAVDPSAPKNPDDVDLTVYGDYAPVDGTTAEFFEELEARMVRAMNPDIGIAQTKEWKFLGEHPRKAFPVILNHLKQIDLSTKEGNEQGKWAVRILENNTGGNNFGWKEFEEDAEKAGPRYHEWYNKKVIIGWCKAWNKAERDLNQWKGLAKLSDSQFEKLKRKLGDSAPEPSALDLLNED
ncbi:MAG: hypothetical protein ACI8TQ_000295 [Planctomycetota bacterium]|jgi:hypothetical protein